MKTEEFQRIKEEYKRIKDLIQERDDLRHTLETKVDTYANLTPLASRLEFVEDELFSIDNDTDIYESLADSVEFERIQCDTDKKLYFFYGLVRKDPNKDYMNQCGDDYVIYIPRNAKLSPFVAYYVLLWDLVNSRGHILVPLKKYEKFKKDNYVYDIGVETNLPFLDDKSYNVIRHSCFHGPDNYEEAYSKLRIELFRSYVHSENEKQAIMTMARKFDL